MPNDENAIASWCTVAASILTVGWYIWNLNENTDDLAKDMKENTNDVKQVTKDVNEIRSLFDELELDTLEEKLSNLQSDVDQRISKLETKVPDLNPTLSRLSVLESELSRVSEYLTSERLDTVYVFKHTFDFPNPTFEVGDNTDSLACSDVAPKVDWDNDKLLAVERKRYQNELALFDNHIEFKFYTMSDEPLATIQDQLVCYKKAERPYEETSISPAPIKIRMQMESIVEDSEGQRGTFSVSDDNIGFDHDSSGFRTYRVSRLREGIRRSTDTDRQLHKLIAILEDRETGKKDCSEYKRQAASGELDRCDLEIFVFAYDSPPLTAGRE